MGEDEIERVLDCLEDRPMDVGDMSRAMDTDRSRLESVLDALVEEGAVERRSAAGNELYMLRSRAAAPDEVRATEEASRRLDEAPTRSEADVNETGSTESVADAQARETPRTVGVVSGKGGVGKTVVTANLGAALHQMGEPVMAMDADAEMSNLALQLGMHSFPAPLEEVMDEGVHIMSAIQIDPASGLKVIPTSLAAEPLPDNVDDIFTTIPADYTLLIDSPPGFERPLERVIETADDLLFVTTPEKTSVTDTYKLSREARRRGKNVVGVVVNMYSSEQDHLSLDEVEGMIDCPIVGVIDQSKHVRRSIKKEEPVVSRKPYVRPSRQFKRLAASITGRSYEESILDKLRGVFS